MTNKQIVKYQERIKTLQAKLEDFNNKINLHRQYTYMESIPAIEKEIRELSALLPKNKTII